jgi:D-lactate dehydrogenase
MNRKIRIVFFDAKDYDIQSFERALPLYRAAHPDLPECEMKFFDTRLSADTVNLAKGADVVCIFVNDIVDGVMAETLAGMGVKLIALRCAGYNNVDVEACFGKIHVVRVPAYSPYAVAEHAMALLLTSIRRIHKAYIRTRDFNFSLSGMTGFDLNGKTVGVVGTGKIGRVFIQICRGFGMHVIAYDKFPAPDSGIEYVTLDELWQRSDIISFHCPLTDENRHMVNADTIARMKKGVVLINTSRGGLIDSEALVEGIKSRQIGAACLDVYEEEANVFFHDYSGHIVDDDTLARLISMPNVILTSHQAFLTKEALGNIAQTTLKNIEDFLQNGMSPNEICYKCPKVAQCDQKHGEKCF